MAGYELVPETAMRAAMHAFNLSLPDDLYIVHPTLRTTDGPYPANYVIGAANEEVWSERLGTRRAWTIFVPYRERWQPNRVFAPGTVVFSPRPIHQLYQQQANSYGPPYNTTGTVEPAFTDPGGSALLDNTCVWQPVDDTTIIPVASTDRLRSGTGNVFDILDIQTGFTRQFRIALIAVERL